MIAATNNKGKLEEIRKILTDYKIYSLKDKNIKPEAKEIYDYLFAEGFERTISHISIGRIQRELKSITNIGFRNNLKILEKYKYLVYKEYDTGLYQVQ